MLRVRKKETATTNIGDPISYECCECRLGELS